MTRLDLEHLIRSAGAIAQDREIVVIGSQSVLGQFPAAPAVLLASMDADVFPLNQPDESGLIDGSIGEGSKFHEQFGYYARGASENTATLPEGWRSRLTAISDPNMQGVTGLCLEVHDLAISKYVAGREKDLGFTRSLAAHGLTDHTTLLERLSKTAVSPSLRNLIVLRIERQFAAKRRPKKS